MAEKRKLLIVEDETAIRQILEIKGRTNGFEVRTAVNGRLGLEVAAEWIPDLIITDHRMPEMSGAEFISAMRQREELAEIPVVLLTGSVVAEYQFSVQLESMHKVTLLRKPFSPRELFRRVNGIVQRQCP